jgi:hypothetical protein|tara:strand:+ start:77 stop:337 length:261 start_codon:yes stop_codon:yes gene_type:complete
MEYIIGLIVLAALGFHFFGSKNETTVAKPVSKSTPKKVTPQPKTPSVAELKKLTKVQLLELADKNNITVKRSGSKAEVVKTISQSK